MQRSARLLEVPHAGRAGAALRLPDDMPGRLQVILMVSQSIGLDSGIFGRFIRLLRELPEIARQFVIRILFVEQPVPQAVIASWSSQVYAK